ncbi:cupin domain-containing protein [Peribacillus cavernae]|uniref:Cupin domain-containing protein n=1 Tax=Peribacillus cavernae TaxID=1674310 RepID=A0A3S0TXM1_9BACI|nr:cupin domain-containing protein [Peribacillus cavernae]MDQ0219711.1 uncharacterized protein YjlB [Peribacillus cavernae]RUQ25988.1 cupin domain-containing protein [Peribacillus cavernae]
MEYTEVETFYFEDDGSIPNNPDIPVLFYPAALKDKASQIENFFNENNWGNSWMNGIFDFHHYHSNTHEVIGVVKGSARLMIGGENGKQFEVTVGDVLVLPAGTGHKRLDSSPDFKVAGAYPDGMEYNTNTGKSEERPYALDEIKSVPLAKQDPVFGTDGPLLKKWGIK